MRAASVSIDLDNKWSYMKTRGDAGWSALPSYLDTVVPRVLDVLDRHGLKITFFVVGQDAARPENRAALASIAAAGHEVANHSFHHEPWLHLYTRADLERELDAAESAIREATGERCVGFRGPGYSFSAELLRLLAARGYEYDGSTFPTFLGPLARLYYFMSSGLSRRDRGQRDLLFGSWRNGLLPLRPYFWDGAGGGLLEIPVTTMPVLRLPIQPSYVLYLHRFSPGLAMAYFRAGLALCRWGRVEPSLLLHPLDFLGREDGHDELRFFPAMDLPAAAKVGVVSRMLGLLTRDYHVVPMREHASLTRREVVYRRGLGSSADSPKRIRAVE